MQLALMVLGLQKETLDRCFKINEVSLTLNLFWATLQCRQKTFSGFWSFREHKTSPVSIMLF